MVNFEAFVVEDDNIDRNSMADPVLSTVIHYVTYFPSQL